MGVTSVQIDNKAIGQRIRDERERLDLTREEFAEIVELSSYYVGQLERGERQMSLPVLVNIANCLHVSLDYLIFGNKPQENLYIYENNNLGYKTNYPKECIEICKLLNKCSTKELDLFKKLIKIILPYINKG